MALSSHVTAGHSVPVRLRVGRLLHGANLDVIRDAAIVFENGRIMAVGEGGSIPSPTGTIELSMPTATALPGLIDAHVHLTFSAGADPVADLRADSEDAQVARAMGNARVMLRAGVTTVLDCGALDPVALRVRAASRETPGSLPTVLVAGSPITPLGGHCSFLGGETPPDAIDRGVRDRAAAGVDTIKIMPTGGRLTQGAPAHRMTYSRDALRAAVDNAHAAGLPITAHIHGVEGLRAATDAGVDSIEHGSMIDSEGAWAFDQEVADAIARSGIRVVPTAAVGRLREVLTGNVDDSYGAPTRIENARRLYESGISLIAGTDAGIGFSDFGSEMQALLEAFVSFGMPPLKAIASATIGAAWHLGVAQSTGSIDVGKVADVVVVEGLPDVDITALRRPRLVVARGLITVVGAL